ncbi:ribonuclease H-like domain-containing protein [Lentinula lateritia]|uniref:Ribonuclease H-like domain-containing protein n=1 Tax=Lentinula lateritia TaxID=40482 RepID=A0ABQ8VKU6_9AGAR|nr:ribonuclease H-like domain-containing protein [Lentinula lateritia]
MNLQGSPANHGLDEIDSQIQASALKAARNSMLLPSDIQFHRTMDAEFSKDLDIFSSRILSIANQVLALMGTADISTKGQSKLETEDDVVDNFHSIVVDTMDRMMEKTDMSLDEHLGRNKAPAIAINANSNATVVKSKPPNRKLKGGLDPAIQHASQLPKPQLNFKRHVLNNDVPWYPTLSHKYNARVPLGLNFYEPDFQLETNSLIKLHPYRYEINHISYPPRMFRSSQPIPPTPFESTTFSWVSDVTALESMLENLRKATEIAVDLEHHSYRSYFGFLCLMQISTRQQDWIVDLLVLREEVGVLNEVFTDSKITKVLHGAESDIVWLQQDFNLYIVNLFDTFHASKLLGFPRHGLANLLEMYCDFSPDKRYQLADWRIRPLPLEMLDYARSDTHFLLYIYDNLRNALLDRAVSPSEDYLEIEEISYPQAQALLRQVLAKSEVTALRVYEKECYDMERGSGGNGWDTLAKKWNKIHLYVNSPSCKQKDIYRSIHMWRDEVAREEDESVRYILPNHYLIQLAEHPPADMAAMLKIFHFVPPVLKRRAKELLNIIREVIKRYDTSSEAKSTQDVVVLEAPPDAMVVEQQSSPIPTESLWTLGPSITHLYASSTLFPSAKPKGLTQLANGNNSVISTAQSALFGQALSASNTETTTALPINRFAEVIARIHSTLIIAPSVLKASSVLVKHETKKTTPAHELNLEQSISLDAEDEGTLRSTVQAEIPFIPSAQRTNNANPTVLVEDTIVVVGQARQKKRKRVKIISNPGEDNPKGGEGDTVPFDFASAPNILDAAPSTEQSSIPRKKVKQAKGRSSLYSEFPAPPRAYSEVKSGNRSHTFK